MPFLPPNQQHQSTEGTNEKAKKGSEILSTIRQITKTLKVKFSWNRNGLSQSETIQNVLSVTHHIQPFNSHFPGTCQLANQSQRSGDMRQFFTELTKK